MSPMQRDIARAEKGLRRKLGRRSGSLSALVAAAGRRMPRRARRAAARIGEMEAMSAHPALSRRVDPKRLRTPFRVLRAETQAYDRGWWRRGLWLDIATTLALNLLLLALVLGALMRWQGLV